MVMFAFLYHNAVPWKHERIFVKSPKAGFLIEVLKIKPRNEVNLHTCEHRQRFYVLFCTSISTRNTGAQKSEFAVTSCRSRKSCEQMCHRHIMSK